MSDPAEIVLTFSVLTCQPEQFMSDSAEILIFTQSNSLQRIVQLSDRFALKNKVKYFHRVCFVQFLVLICFLHNWLKIPVRQIHFYWKHNRFSSAKQHRIARQNILENTPQHFLEILFLHFEVSPWSLST